MSDTLKKVISGAVSTITAVAMVVGSYSPAQADWSSQKLIKTADSPAVYLQDGGKRYVFVHALAYFSWFPDFSQVQTISNAEMQAIPLGGNVHVRPGTDLLQFHSGANVRAYDPALPVYVVGENGKLYTVKTAAQQQELAKAYGSDWSSKVVKLSDAFFATYTVVGEYTSAMYPDGTLIQYEGDPQTYLIEDGEKRPVTSEAFVANNFQSKYVVTAPSSMTYSNGSAVNAQESMFSIMGNQEGGNGSVPNPSGALSVMLDTSNPASTFVPSNATNVPFMSFKVSAGSGSVTIDTLTVRRYGAGASTDYSNVYLYDGDERLTLGRTVNSSTNEAKFTGLNYMIPANSSKVLTVTGDLAGTSSGNVGGFEIVSADAVETDSTVTGTFPVRGNLMSFTSATTGTLTVTKSGAPSNPKVGDEDVELASFQLQAGSSEDLSLRRVKLYQGGSVRNNDLENLTLTQAGNVLATADGIGDDNTVTFSLNTPFAMQKGDTKTFQVRGDISLQSRVATTIQFYLDQDSDIYAMGQTYGFGAGITNTDFDSSNSPTLTLSGAQLTTTFEGPVSQEIARNQTDVALYEGTMSAGANIEVRKAVVVLSSSANLGDGTTAYYTNVKLSNADTGQILFGPTDAPVAAATSGTVTLNGPYTFEPGEMVNFNITANISNSATADSTIKATLNAFASGDVRNLDSGVNVPSGDIVPATALVGNNHTVRASAVTIDLANSPSTQTETRGTLDRDMLGVIVRASNSQDIELRQLTSQLYIGGSTGTMCGSTAYFDTDSATPGTGEVQCAAAPANGTVSTVKVQDRVSTVELYDESTGQKVGDAESVDTNGLVTFDNLNFDIPAGSSRTLLMRFDISNNSIEDVSGNFIPYGISADVIGSTTDYAAKISAVDEEGNTAAVTGPTGSLNATTSPKVYISVISNGTVTSSSISDGDVQSKIVIGGANAVAMGKYRFEAVNEAMTIKKLKVQVQDSGSAAYPNNVVGVWIVDGSDVYGQGGKGATSPVSINDSGIAKFDGLDIVVPKDDTKTLTVKIDTKTVSGGAQTGKQFKTVLLATGATDTDVEAQGNSVVLNGTNVIGSTTVNGNLSKIYKSVPSISANTSGLNSTFETGTSVKLYKFNVTADTAGDIELGKISFNISNGSDWDVDTLHLYDVTSTEQLLSGTAAAAIASGVADFAVGTEMGAAIFVPKGSTKTFELRARVYDAGAPTAVLGGDIITTSIAGGDVNANSANFAGTTGTLIWSDMSLQDVTPGSTITSVDWNNGYLVQTLPTDGFSKQTSF